MSYPLEQLDALPGLERHDRLFPGPGHAVGLSRATLLTGDVHHMDRGDVDLEQLLDGATDHDLICAFAHFEDVFAHLVEHRVLFTDDRSDEDLMRDHQGVSSFSSAAGAAARGAPLAGGRPTR